MTDQPAAPADPQAMVAAAIADLENDASAKTVFAQLRAIEDKIPPDSPLRATFLLARGIANNRLALRGEALGDLHDARRLLEASTDRRDAAKVLRTIAVVHSWRAELREAALALLDAVGEGAAANDLTAIALALIEGARLQIEIGRPREAQELLARALEVGGSTLPQLEHQRAAVNLLQALVAAGCNDEARTHLQSLGPLLAAAKPRLKLLVEIEAARIDHASGDRDAARAAIARATSLVPSDPDCFERTEVGHVEAELALKEGDAARAAQLLQDVVARYADDDLAGREVIARLLQAQALDELGRTDEADRTLAAALRRALERQLSGHTDAVRSRIAIRGGVEDAWTPGEVAAGPVAPDSRRRFVRQRPLGEGGYGSVVRAYDLELGIEVALKTIKLEGMYDSALRNRLLASARAEIAAASRIGHPGIARIYGLLIEPNGDARLVEQWVEGPTLSDAMKKPIKPVRALDILARTALALAAVHDAGVIHRDLKPDNVMLRGSTSPVIIDFGIALIGRRVHASGRVGTRLYMSPEQARGGTVDARADLYSLGVIAHELLTGKLPAPLPRRGLQTMMRFWRAGRDHKNLIDIGVEPIAADLILRLLAPNPWQRPRSAAVVAAGFTDAAGALTAKE